MPLQARRGTERAHACSLILYTYLIEEKEKRKENRTTTTTTAAAKDDLPWKYREMTRMKEKMYRGLNCMGRSYQSNENLFLN